MSGFKARRALLAAMTESSAGTVAVGSPRGMSSTLRVSVGRFFDRVARVEVSRARAVAPAALAALVFAARRPVRGALASVALVSVAAAVVRLAFPRLVRVAVVPP